METSFYSRAELKKIGLKSLGKNVLISRFAQLYSPESIEIGNNVRIDDFCIIAGNIKLGSFIHISAYCALYGKFGIEMRDFSGLSPRCTLLSASDDFSGNYLIGPMVDKNFTHVTGGRIIISKYSQTGAGCVLLPGVTIGEGVTVGAMSLINKDLNAWGIYKGIPAVYYKRRSKNLLKYVVNHV
ncbi:MAG: acyltransferase [Syntrophales bacterium]